MTEATRVGTGERRRWAGFAHGLRLSTRRWEFVGNDDLTRATMVVLAAWVILAWSRFGAQSFNGMRAFTRFVLVGVYAWFGLTAALWVAARIRTRARPTEAPTGDGRRSPWRLLAMLGLAHQPLLVAGALLWFLQIAPHSALNTVVGAAAVALMGGQVVAATGVFEQRSSLAWPSSLSVVLSTVAVWLLWLATAGRFLAERVGHLV